VDRHHTSADLATLRAEVRSLRHVVKELTASTAHALTLLAEEHAAAAVMLTRLEEARGEAAYLAGRVRTLEEENRELRARLDEAG
jgi:predicted nuclease with TOPRIM domain